MRDRLKRAAVIYLILVVLGVAAYFAVQALKGGFSLAGGSGGGNVFQAGTQESSSPSTADTMNTSGQRPTAQLLAETQGGSGGSTAQTQTNNDTAQSAGMSASQDSSGGGINLAQMAGVVPVDTSSNITPQPGNSRPR